jgi:hypothetical protein
MAPRDTADDMCLMQCCQKGLRLLVCRLSSASVACSSVEHVTGAAEDRESRVSHRMTQLELPWISIDFENPKPRFRVQDSVS